MIQGGKQLSANTPEGALNKFIQSSERIEWFRPLTARAVLMYKILAKMQEAKTAYNFSLTWFVCILLTVIRDGENILIH